MGRNYFRDEDGGLIILCVRDRYLEFDELKTAMACRRNINCKACGSYNVCNRVLTKRKKQAGEH